MSFLQKIKKPKFWASFTRVALPFFITLTIIMLLFKSWSDLFLGDFNAISEAHFANGRWKSFFGIKLVASVLYGFYTANKNFK